MTSELRNRQLPGRQEALRLALEKPATPLMRHIAGLDKVMQRKPSCQQPQTFTIASCLDELTDKQRAALPF